MTENSKSEHIEPGSNEVELTVEGLETPRPRTFKVETPHQELGTLTPHGVGSIDVGEVIGKDKDGEDVLSYTVKVADFSVPALIIIEKNSVSEYGDLGSEIVWMNLGGVDKGGKIPSNVIEKAHGMEALMELSSGHLAGEAKENAMRKINKSQLKVLE